MRQIHLSAFLIAGHVAHSQYYEVGVDLILCAFLHYTDELPAFGRKVIPLVQQLEAKRHPVLERVA